MSHIEQRELAVDVDSRACKDLAQSALTTLMLGGPRTGTYSNACLACVALVRVRPAELFVIVLDSLEGVRAAEGRPTSHLSPMI